MSYPIFTHVFFLQHVMFITSLAPFMADFWEVTTETTETTETVSTSEIPVAGEVCRLCRQLAS